MKNKLTLIVSILFAGLSAWWIYLVANDLPGETDQAELFSATYGVMALLGGLIGLWVSRRWGGFRSLIGKSTLLVALGLLFQEAGQITYSLYTYLFHIEIPYPSWGDVGFFGSVVLYILAAFYLIKALSSSSTFTSKKNLIAVIGVPLILLAGSYAKFLQNYEYSGDKLAAFLDFGYPLGQAFYLSLAILAYIISRKYLGGLMKPVIIFLILAFFAQYISDFTFLYSVNQDTWKTAGTNDYTYLISYFIMTLVLIKFGAVAKKLADGGKG